MVLEPAVDTTFNIRYSQNSDRFTIETGDAMPVYDATRVTFDDSDFILFDNERPGNFRCASHRGTNQLAIEALSHAIFDHNYPLFCEGIREGSKLYGSVERTAQIIVPYSNNRRLARIALHAKTENASQEVMDLHTLITSQQKR